MASNSSHIVASLIVRRGNSLWIVDNRRGLVSAHVMPRWQPLPDQRVRFRDLPRCVRRAAREHFKAAARGGVDLVRSVEL